MIKENTSIYTNNRDSMLRNTPTPVDYRRSPSFMVGSDKRLNFPQNQQSIESA